MIACAAPAAGVLQLRLNSLDRLDDTTSAHDAHGGISQNPDARVDRRYIWQ